MRPRYSAPHAAGGRRQPVPPWATAYSSRTDYYSYFSQAIAEAYRGTGQARGAQAPRHEGFQRPAAAGQSRMPCPPPAHQAASSQPNPYQQYAGVMGTAPTNPPLAHQNSQIYNQQLVDNYAAQVMASRSHRPDAARASQRTSQVHPNRYPRQAPYERRAAAGPAYQRPMYFAQPQTNQTATARAAQRANAKRAAEARTNYPYVSQWPIGQAVYGSNGNVVGGTHLVYQPETQTLGAAQIVYQPATDTYATAQIVYQPHTNCFSTSQLVYQPQTEKIATAEAVYRPHEGDVVMATRQTSYEPQANEITTTEAVYQPSEDMMSSKRTCIQTQTDEVTTTEAVYRPQANVLATRVSNFNPQMSGRTTENGRRPHEDVPARKQTKKKDVKTASAVCLPSASVAVTKPKTNQTSGKEVKSKKAANVPVAQESSHCMLKKLAKIATTCTVAPGTPRKVGRPRKDSTNQESPPSKPQNPKSTSHEAQSDTTIPILRQLLALQEQQREMRTTPVTSSRTTNKTDFLKTYEKYLQKQLAPSPKLPQNARKRTYSTTSESDEVAQYPHAVAPSATLLAIAGPEWLQRLQSSTSLPQTSNKSKKPQKEPNTQKPTKKSNAVQILQEQVFYTAKSPVPLHEELAAMVLTEPQAEPQPASMCTALELTQGKGTSPTTSPMDLRQSPGKKCQVILLYYCYHKI